MANAFVLGPSFATRFCEALLRMRFKCFARAEFEANEVLILRSRSQAGVTKDGPQDR